MRVLSNILYILHIVNSLSTQNSFVPDLKKRKLMNSILLYGGIYPTISFLAYPYFSFFVPRINNADGSGQPALTKLGDKITLTEWKKLHGASSKELVQGLAGDPTYLLLDNEKNLENFALNAICTHLGCVVPFNKAANKFMCPCHGSQYDNQGKVIRGPAPLSLQMAKVEINNDDILLSKWLETDFRTGESPWWIK